DNVEWSEEQEAAARKKVEESCSQLVPSEKREDYENKANSYWNDFYKIHDNRFFKDRHWLFTEFPELVPNCKQSLVDKSQPQATAPDSCEDTESKGCKDDRCPSQTCLGKAQTEPSETNINYPGFSATFRILEVGCGAGNTVFPILKTNNDPAMFVYCCDFSSTAVEIVKMHPDYNPSRCFAFVHDLCDESDRYPVPDNSLDIIILIFVLSAIHPDKMQAVISGLNRLLKPGGMILFRDYGRYDLAQLRFKKGRCLSENFYVRGDGTRVYFFTQEGLEELFTSAGMEKVQNLVDRRLQVNRGKQLTMYRVWIQCKYRKPLEAES
uniref:tRNA N(3)-cytidine methyltransferase n=1 Tax=Callorhinchus milii TaxID=7868 RepID=A0A4W3HUC3_CALMI